MEPQKLNALVTNDEQIFKFLTFVINKAKKQINPKRIILFGSRARGTANKFSDIDLSFEFDERSHRSNWAEFWMDLEYEAPILLEFDLVEFDTAPEGLKTNILKDGKVIYER